MNGCVVYQLIAQSVQTSSLSSNGMSIIGNGSVSSTLAAGSLSAGIATVYRLQATGLLPSSYPTAGVFLGLVPTVDFASVVFNSSNASKLSN